MMIFVLASGYLFAVYLLLALAKRTEKKTTPTSLAAATKGKHNREVSLSKVTQVSSVR